MARRDGRPAALLSAERRRLGRLALARHGDVARPLVDRAIRPRRARARSGQGTPAVRREGTRRQCARVLACAGAERPHAHCAGRVRTGGARRRRKGELEEAAVPADGRERPAASDRGQPRAANRMSRDCNHCVGLSRSRLLHRAAAEAGRGLPLIEPGMPLPAGTGMSRRSFVTRSLGAALSVYGADRLLPGLFDEGIALAASGPAPPILVSVFLEGGADALSVLSPQGDPLYGKLRPKLGLSGGTQFAEDGRLFWHPSLASLVQLYGEQKVTVMPAIGYTNADQSHFTSRHYWEVGATSTQLRTGWLGRYLDVVGTPDNPLQGLSLDNSLAPALATAKLPVASIDGPDQYDFWSSNVWGEVETRMLSAIGSLGSPVGDGAFDTAAKVTAQVDRLRNQLLPFQGDAGFGTTVPYPKSDDDF